MNHPPRRSGVALATIAALTGNSIFGFSFMFSRMALRVAPPFVMLMYRFLTAFAALHGVVLWSRLHHRTDWLRFDISWRHAGALLMLGLIEPVIYFLCESYGVSLTNATVSGIMIALIPIAALLAGALFLHERPTWKQVGFSLLSIGGVIMMTLQQSASGDIHPLGIVLLIGAIISGAAFTMLSRKLSTRYSALERTYVMLLVAAVSFTALALIQCRADLSALLAPLHSPTFLLSMLYLSLLSSILAFLLLNYAATELPVSKTAAFCNVTTVLSVFAGVVFLGEPFAPVSLLAAAIIIAGVFGVQRT